MEKSGEGTEKNALGSSRESRKREHPGWVLKYR